MDTEINKQIKVVREINIKIDDIEANIDFQTFLNDFKDKHKVSDRIKKTI